MSVRQSGGLWLAVGDSVLISAYVRAMLSPDKIDQIVLDIAGKRLPRESVDRVASFDAIDSEGHDAVRIVITLRPELAADIDGDAVLDTLVGIQSRLAAAGEDRFPLVEYESADDVEMNGVAES